ncbi:MAG: choice-of-anchor J domain-containing protein [Candidatus Hydrothermales bacterium]
MRSIILIFLLFFTIPLKAQWVTLLNENFEAGVIPSGWSVYNGNGDGYTWTVGTSTDLGAYPPPNYGTKYAYYTDDDAGSGAPITDEQLITPSLSVSQMDILILIFSWGFNMFSPGQEFYYVKVRFFSGGSWGPWIQVANLPGDANGVDTIDLSSYLPKDSVKIMFQYVETTARWNWAVAVDNVTVMGRLLLQNNMKVVKILYPTDIVDRYMTHYPKVWVQNTGLQSATYNAIFDIYDSLFTTRLYSDTLLNNSLASGGSDTLNFDKGFNPPYIGWYKTKATIVFPPDQYPQDNSLTSQFYAFAPPESLTESFENNFPPFLWSLSGQISWRWGPYYGDNIVEPSNAYHGTRYASFPSFNTHRGLKGALISPGVRLNPIYGTPRVFFWAWNRGTANNNDTLKVFVSIDKVTWNLIDRMVGDFERIYALSLSAYSNQTVYIKWEGISDDGISNIVIDYVKISYGTDVSEVNFGKEKDYMINSLSKDLKIKFIGENYRDIILNIYSKEGRKVKSIKKEDIREGKGYIQKVPSGLYLIKGKIESRPIREKVIILK